MSTTKHILIYCCLFFSIQHINGQIILPKILGNNMILQRNKPVPVWGRAKVGSAITVSFHQQMKNAVTDKNGSWKVLLDPMDASEEPSKMIVSDGQQKVVLENILVGEVWLCSGQSNMEYPMRRISKLTVPVGENWPVNELTTAHNKNIRIFLVERKRMNPDSLHKGWSVAEDSALRSFSAVGYFFAKELNKDLNVPVGVISSAIPGSRIEPWIPKEAFTVLPFFNEKTDSIHSIDGEPGKFYTPMIEPLIPFALKGFLWYQGESNCFLNERLQYAYKMKALINYWRNAWGSNGLPFYYVQIAPFAYSKTKGNNFTYTEESLPEFWEAQQLALQLPYTGMIATTDLNFDLNNLHPHFKWEVGRRLAVCALAKAYGRRDLVPMGPVFTGMKIQANQIIIDFKYTGSGLISKDGKPLNGFTIADKDGKFIPAQAVIKYDEVYVWSDSIQHPVAVRFGWNEADHCNLYNRDGLPALPFRTDNPLIGKFK